MTVSPPERIIVIGASSGGHAVLSEILRGIPEGFPAALVIVHHLSPRVPSRLDEVLGKESVLPVTFVEHGTVPETGHIYIAPPDHHVVVNRDRLRLHRGPRVNLARPAIDIAFRSAAVAFGHRVIGVILTGLLDDGASGMSAIKACGGIAVVQDPADAEYREMPDAAIDAAAADHVVLASKIADLLAALVAEPLPPRLDIPPGLIAEMRLEEQARSDIELIDSVGGRAAMSCPDCGGPLWNIADNGPEHYRCHIGHGYSSITLVGRQKEKAQEALWVALRTLEERTRMLRRLARSEETAGRRKASLSFADRAEESMKQANVLRDLAEYLLE